MAGSVPLRRFKARDTACQFGDAAQTGLLHEFDAVSCGAEDDLARVDRVGGALGKLLLFQPIDDATHCRWTHLLGSCQLPQRLGSSEYEHRQSGEPGGADSGRRVLLAQAAQQVDGGGVKLVSDLDGFTGRQG